MVNTDKLRGLAAERGLSGSKVAEMLGITSTTYYSKLKTGDFNSGEMSALVKILDIQNPIEIFFAELVS